MRPSTHLCLSEIVSDRCESAVYTPTRQLDETHDVCMFSSSSSLVTLAFGPNQTETQAVACCKISSSRPVAFVDVHRFGCGARATPAVASRVHVRSGAKRTNTGGGTGGGYVQGMRDARCFLSQ